MSLNNYTKYMSEMHEPGYDTVLGYMAKNMPQEIDDMIDAVTDTIHLNRLCVKARRITLSSPYIMVAPLVLREAGIHKIEAFPVSVIQKVLSE